MRMLLINLLLREKTHDFLISKARKLVDNHQASNYKVALLQVCDNIDESFKLDLIDFIKQGYLPDPNNRRGWSDLLNALIVG